METTYGSKDLQQYAEDIGVEYQSLKTYKWVSEQWESVNRITNQSWTAHMVLAAHPKRHELIQKVRTVKEARQAIKGREAGRRNPPALPDLDEPFR